VKKSVETREKILEAAKKAFAQKGFHGVSMEEIARNAGVKKALIYYYFPSKEDLFFEVWQRSVDEMEESILKPLEGEGNFAKKLKALLKSYVDFVRSRSDTLRLVERERFYREEDGGIWSKIRKRYRELLAKVAGMVEEGKREAEVPGDIDSMATAQFILGSLSTVDQTHLENLQKLIMRGVIRMKENEGG